MNGGQKIEQLLRHLNSSFLTIFCFKETRCDGFSRYRLMVQKSVERNKERCCPQLVSINLSFTKIESVRLFPSAPELLTISLILSLFRWKIGRNDRPNVFVEVVWQGEGGSAFLAPCPFETCVRLPTSALNKDRGFVE